MNANNRNKRKCLLCTVLAVLAMTVFMITRAYLRRMDKDSEPVLSEALSGGTDLDPMPPPFDGVNAIAEIVSPSRDVPVVGGRSDAIYGTSSMIAAHAPLREVEIANPDSKSNRIVLTFMLNKAINNLNRESSSK